MSQIQLGKAIFPRQEILAASGRYYFPINLSGHQITGIQVRWFDATVNFNTSEQFHFSCMEEPTRPATGGSVDLSEWDQDTTISFTGAAASAAGSEVLHLGNTGAKWLLFSVDPSADGEIEIWSHGTD